MKNIINLSLKIFILNICSLFLFTDSALSQKREFEIQDCSISVDKSELIISAGGGENGCKYQHKFTEGSTEYQLNFDVGYNKPNSRVEIINNGRKYTVLIPDFVGISTYIKTYFLHLNKKETPFLVVMYGTDGNGYSPCNFHKIMVFNESIKSGNFVVKSEDLNVSPTSDDDYTISSCLSFEDLDSDNIYELIAPDNILAYAFLDFDLSGFGAFYQIKRISSNGINDITNQHKNFIGKVAEENWNEVLQKVSLAQKDSTV